MDASQAINLVKQGLGFRQDLDANILQALNDTQDEFEGAATLPWFLVTELTFGLAVGVSTRAIPTDFIREVEDEPMRLSESGQRVPKYPYDDLLARGGSGFAYAVRASVFTFSPAPIQSTVSFTLSYYRSQPNITAATAATTNAWLKNVPRMLIGRAGAILAADLEDEAGEARFNAMYGRWKGWLMARIVERESANMPYALGRNN